MKLAFGVPWSSPFGWTAATDALLRMERPAWARNAVGHWEPLEVRYFRGSGWCPAARHTSLCEQALEWGADLILVLGADQIHPPDTLVRLVERFNQGFALVAAMVPARGFVGWQDMKPFQPMAWRLRSGSELDLAGLNGLADAKNEIDVVDPADGEIQRANFIGSGVLMFHRDHLLALKRPWFYESVDRESYRRLACMDTTFVWRLQTEAGAELWVDTTIKVRHLHAFEIDETFQTRFGDWAGPGSGDPAICRYEPQPTEATS